MKKYLKLLKGNRWDSVLCGQFMGRLWPNLCCRAGSACLVLVERKSGFNPAGTRTGAERLGRNGSHHPVLKHGPRSLTCVRVLWSNSTARNESKRRDFCIVGGMSSTRRRSQSEHVCWDPKDGELCLSRMKPGETLVEVRSDSNVQIDRGTWV